MTKHKEPSYAEIKFSDNVTTPLQLSSQSIRVQVTLPVARVTTVMKFKSHHKRVLEGELVFPLPESATVTGYALDVNGVLVDAVPVEKEKARAVFEEEVRSRQSGVAMVEMVAQSNSFKLRVYPLVPDQERTIKVVYMMPVNVSEQSSVYVPYGCPGDNIDSEVTIEWFEGMDLLKVLLVKDGAEMLLNKTVRSEGSYQVVTLNKTDIEKGIEGIVATAKSNLQDEQVVVQGNYFSSRMKVKVPKESKRLDCDKIQILWDSSYSRRSNQRRDVNLLQKILAELSPKEIVFTTFSISAKPAVRFTSTREAIDYATSIVYDGATDLSNLISAQDESVSFSIVFTDGLHTIGTDFTPDVAFSKPLYIISTSIISNHRLFSNIATKSGGMFFNCLSDNEIVEQVGKAGLYFAVAEYEEDELEEVYPNEPILLDQTGCFTIYGKVKAGGELAVTFRFGLDIVETKLFSVEPPSDTASEPILALLWAKQKMDSLCVFPELFKDELQELGREFSIVTPNTSFIVLESLEQYLKYRIIPPVTLPKIREQYMNGLAEEVKSKEVSEKNKINQVLQCWKSRIEWHKREFNPIAKAEKKNSKKRKRSASLERGNQTKLIRTVASRKSMVNPVLIAPECCDESDCEEDMDDDFAEDDSKQVDTKTISVQKYVSKEGYMKEIQNATNHYNAYLEMREKYETSPGFFLDIADYWFSYLQKPEEGVNILTNILELELENAQLLRIVAYRLDQEKFYSLAENAFERVKKMNPHEPQSYRDLALVKEKLGKLSEAVDLLNHVIAGKWESRFAEIEQTAAIELSHILFKDPTLNPCHEDFRYLMDLDLRVSMAWDSDSTDIDLHVTENCPGGQEAYYAKNRTQIGGFVSRDFVSGYGPEEYMLKRAPKGSYDVFAKYFASHQQSLTGGTTILLTFFTNYMRPNEKSESVTVRLTKNHEKLPVCTITV